MAAMKANHCATSAKSAVLRSTANIALLTAHVALVAMDISPMAVIALTLTSATKVLLHSLTAE